MSQADNHEIDRLLRSFAKAEDGSKSNRSRFRDANPAVSDHLDADELNSYAEGAIPDAARTRYTRHLADCDSCRHIVIDLSRSAGALHRSETSEPASQIGFRQKLATLLWSPTWRYAIPALLLTAVIGATFLALRQQRREPEFVAQNQPSASTNEQPTIADSARPSATAEARPYTPKQTESPSVRDSLNRQNSLDDQKLRTGESGGKESKDVTPVGGRAREVGQLEDSAVRSELPPGYAPAPKAAAAPTTAAPTVGSYAEKSADLARQQPAKREEQERDELYKNKPTEEHGPNRSVTSRAAGVANNSNNRRLDGLNATRGGPYNEPKKDKASEVESRTVSGRRFVREGNAWVDTAYDPSRTPVKVTRGSEQFRALVADEPGLRTISEQLGGVVIVVWKNRAYRLQ